MAKTAVTVAVAAAAAAAALTMWHNHVAENVTKCPT